MNTSVAQTDITNFRERDEFSYGLYFIRTIAIVFMLYNHNMYCGYH